MSDYEEMLAVFKAGFRARFDAPGLLKPEGDEAIRAGIRAVVDALVREARGWKAGNSDDSQRMVWLMNKQADALEGSEGLTVHYLNRAEAAEAEVERLKGVLEFVDLNISKDNEAAKEAIRSALEAKP